MVLSQKSQYAVRAVFELANLRPDAGGDGTEVRERHGGTPVVTNLPDDAKALLVVGRRSLQVVEPFARGLVPAVDDPAVGVQQGGWPKIAIAVPPIAGARGRARGLLL